MSVHRSCVIALSVAAGLAACAPDHRHQPLGPPALDATAGGTVSGSVLGPITNICDSLPTGATLAVVAIDLAAQRNVGARNLTCPANAYSFFLPAGSYLLRAQLTPGAAVESGRPWRTITVPPVEVTEGDVVRDLPVDRGLTLDGGVTIDGQPLEGVALNLSYAEAPGFATMLATSGPDGAWAEFIGRSPALLQSGIQVQPSIQCDALGALLVTPPRTSAFLFPDEANGISCGFTESPAVQFSHTRTRLVVTPMPGEIGGLDAALADQFGTGWGVQFPVSSGGPVHGSIGRSELFRGGLIVGIAPDRLLTGVDVSGYVQCEPDCRDFGLDGRLQFNRSPTFGTKVTWHYSDAASSEGVGLKVVQKSYDGVPPADYVLFRFSLKNSAAAPLTFYAGMWADWDIGDEAVDNVGATDLDGRLMYMTTEGGGTLAGSLLLSDAPISGNRFMSLRTAPPAASEYVSSMAGDVQQPSAETPDDYLALHAVGPITLAPGGATDVWIAIVAGDDRSQLLANAAAAAADVAHRRSGGNSAEATAPQVTTSQRVILNRGVRASPRAATVICKRGCAPLR